MGKTLDILRLYLCKIHSTDSVLIHKTDTKCFVLLSGGIDSTVALFWAKQFYPHIYTIEFTYCNRGKEEIKRLRELKKHLKLQTIHIEYPKDKERFYTISESNSFYYLTASHIIKDVLKKTNYRKADIISGQILSDWWNKKNGKYKADASPSFYFLLNKILEKEHEGCQIRIRTPFIFFDKTQVVSLGVELDVPLALTWSCSQSQVQRCSLCIQCKERAVAFKEFGIKEK